MQNQYGEIKSLSSHTNNEFAKKKVNREIQLIALASKQTPGQRWETSMQTLRPPEDGQTSCTCGLEELL